jgi:hypothetical protein
MLRYMYVVFGVCYDYYDHFNRVKVLDDFVYAHYSQNTTILSPAHDGYSFMNIIEMQ